MQHPRRILPFISILLTAACQEPFRVDSPGQIAASPSSLTTTSVCDAITHLWPGEGTPEDVPGPSDGNFWGTGTTYAPGVLGQAFSFDGADDFMQLADVLDEQAGTVEFWVKRGDLTNGSDVYFGAYYNQSTPTLFMRESQTLLWEIGTSFGHDTGIPLPVGEWHHLAMTWSSSDAIGTKEVWVYVDGVRVDGTIAYNVTDFPAPKVGAFDWMNSVDQFAQALIDEITIYSRALTAEEISTIYTTHSAEKCTTPPPPQWAFAGFFPPVDQPTVAVNKAKAGSAVPVKFSLGGDKGLAIFKDGFPKPVGYACDNSAVDPIEITVAANLSFLSYDASSDQYIYTWKTDKAFAGKCLQLHLGLLDGTDRYAKFQFIK